MTGERENNSDFNTFPAMAIDLTSWEAVDHRRKYEPGGEHFRKGTSDRVGDSGDRKTSIKPEKAQ